VFQVLYCGYFVVVKVELREVFEAIHAFNARYEILPQTESLLLIYSVSLESRVE
jgi:hypothetical protein